MCGIAGILGFGKVKGFDASRSLSSMLNAIKHRGPDDRGEINISGDNGLELWLGHQRLSIIDLSDLGHQPMSNSEKTLWVCSNGEIYNFRELRKQLYSKFTFLSESDTEVLLRSYQAWGEACLEKLVAMFAFAIWDVPRQKLFLARDRLGIKPLYYCFNDKHFLFASETRSLTASGLVSRQINHQGLFDYLAYGRPQGPESIISNIYELPPGCYLEVSAKGVSSPVKYWDPFFSQTFSGREKDLTDRIQELLLESVRSRIIGDVPVGAFLSGGIDSSSIATLLSHVSENKFKTISVGFREKEFDESEFSLQIAKSFGTDHQTLLIEREDLLKSLPISISAMDQPTVDGINTFLISQAARNSGLKVILSGLGGDELFAGYNSFSQVPILIRCQILLKLIPGPLRKCLGFLSSSILPRSDRFSKLSQLISGQALGGHAYYLFRALFGLPSIQKLIVDSEIIDKALVHHMEITEMEIEKIKTLDPIQKVSWLELTHYLPNMLLRDSDVMSMAHGLELRVPLIDHRLVELMMTVPQDMRMKPGKVKPLLVDSLPKSLPSKLVNRKKMGFTLPFDIWMRTCLKNEVETVLLSPIKNLKDILSESEIQKVWGDFLNRKTSWSRPWSLYILKKWVDQNIG